MNPFRPRHGARPLAALVAVVGLLAGAEMAGAAEPGSCPHSDATPTAANHQQIETATACLVNAERSARGLQPLRHDPRLQQAARMHTDDMQAHGHFSHTGSDGSTASDRMRAAGYYSDGAENLLKGTVTPAEAVALWLDSPTHSANLLEPAYRGIGTAQGGEYWTQSFGKAEPPGSSSPSAHSVGSGEDPGGEPLGGEGGSPAGSGSAFEAAGPFPAKFRVRRARVDRGLLDALVEVSARANGDAVRVSFIANGRRLVFTERVQEGRLRFRKPLPKSQRSVSTGIMEIDYGGNQRVRPAEVRARAARRSAGFERRHLSLHGGVLRAQGTISRRARGVVRLHLSTAAGDRWSSQARLANGTWQLEETLPPGLRQGGYLTMQFTGYLPAHIRGAQIAKELLAGQSFVTGG